jgi:hypothetical protein
VGSDVGLAARPRWRGQPGRLEVHYLTATDATTGTGLWLHHEVVAPTDGGAPYEHGWMALFPVSGAPSYTRFGPAPAQPADGERWYAAPGVEMTATTASGNVDGVGWDLRWQTDDAPLWTFPRWAWQRQALPAAQVLAMPRATVTGNVAGRPFAGRGALAHIYGHGNAHRWVWLHADLGDDAVLEVVAATARRPGLRLLPPLPLLALRVGDSDWPRDPLAAAPLLRARIEPHAFRVAGTVGTRRIRVTADLPAERCVAIGYTDPDGATATCTNTERADVTVTVDDLTVRGRRARHSWRLDGTGHAEIGTRP